MNSKVFNWLGHAGILCLLCIGSASCSDSQSTTGQQQQTNHHAVTVQPQTRAEESQTLASVSLKHGRSVKRNHYIDSISAAKERWADWVRKHPFSNRDADFLSRADSIPKRDRPDLAAEFDFLRTVDPALGVVPRERLFAAEEQARQISMNAAIAGITWTERGPANVGGRTRAMAFDPNDGTNKKFWGGRCRRWSLVHQRYHGDIPRLESRG